MKLLLDTCSFLWMISEPDRLGGGARTALEDGENEVVLHQVSSLEIQLKFQIGKLKLANPPEELVTEGVRRHALHYQTLSDSEIWFLQKLPFHHRDPFDRLLIASALHFGLQIVTPDPLIDKYSVRTIW